MLLTKIRGTRDIIPFTPYIQLYQKLRSHLLLHNFTEIHTPYFEQEIVFSKNLGILSDIVNKEMYYVSNKNKAEEQEKIVLRPEFTAGFMRAYLENGIQESPWKVFSIGAAFRHERPQKGRFREFFQCNIECIDAKSLGYDLELIQILYTLFSEILPNSFTLHINYIGTHIEREHYKEALYNYCLEKKNHFPENTVDKLSKENILRILDNKNETIQDIIADAPKISSFWTKENQKEWQFITDGLSYLKIPYFHNERLIRGLDYYNGLIFEFPCSLLGSQSALGGGGRYDSLATAMGSKKETPALGCGIGIDRILIASEQISKNQFSLITIPFIAIIIISEENNSIYYYALAFKKKLEEQSISVKIYFDKASIKSGLKKANAESATLACIISQLEMESHTISIKEMTEHGKQVLVPLANGIDYCIKKIKK